MQHGDQLEMVSKEVTSEERHIVNLTAEAMLRDSAAVEQAEDKSWDIEVAKQLEVIRIASECSDATKHSRMHIHLSKGNKLDLWMEVVNKDLKRQKMTLAQHALLTESKEEE